MAHEYQFMEYCDHVVKLVKLYEESCLQQHKHVRYCFQKHHTPNDYWLN